jgi:poly-gamma-glutamate capsule biosynthesis protein CapA/YwtB (metallophosphatase superfamily)
VLTKALFNQSSCHLDIVVFTPYNNLGYSKKGNMRIRYTIIILALLFIFPLSAEEFQNINNYSSRGDIIENFDDGVIELLSYPGQDMDPDDWALDSINTYDSTPYSLTLYGNTWKLETIDSVALDTGDVWQVAAFVEDRGEIQGFGLMDSVNTLFYSFAGSEQLAIEEWVTVYQGAFPLYTWNIYQLPVGEDWLAWFGYLPTVTGIVFINDRDVDPTAVVYFDEIIDITSDLPISPQVSIWYTIGKMYKNVQGLRSVDVQFYSEVIDPDSGDHEYFWYFGDDSTSSEPNPFHTYIVEDDHEYTVLLEVVDSTELWGRATCSVTVDPGPTTFPITMNFVGDVMLARGYEVPGGIIDSLGVEAIFDQTLRYLGYAADITVANLECPLCSTGTPHPTKPIIFRGSPENVAGLVHAGIDVVSLANNHIIDYSLEGLQETQDVLAANDILCSGAGANSYEAYVPLFYVKDGVTITFLASCNRTGQYDNYQPYLNAGFNKPGFAHLTEFNLSQQIQTVIDDADIIVVEMHAGNEYSIEPPRISGGDYHEDEFYSPFYRAPRWDDIQLRHQAIDEGADIVVCHHAHLLQPLEVYNGKLIAHSLGDFTFDLNYPETFPSMILNAEIDETGIYDYSVTPVYIDDYIPRRARGQLGLYILDNLARRSKELETYVIVQRDEVIADIILDTLELTPVTYSYIEELEIQEDNGYWRSEPLHLERKGSISSILSMTPSRDWQFRLGRQLIWFGNFEDEGCTMWLLNQPDEFYDDTHCYGGRRSMCQSRPMASGPIITNFEKRIIYYSDTSYYTVHGYIETENAENADIIARYYYSRTSPFVVGACSLDTEVDGTTDWTFYCNEFMPASNTQFVDICLKSEGPPSGEGYAWFDDIGIIEWEAWQNFTGADNFSTPNDFYWIQIRTDTETDSAVLFYEEIDYNPAPAVGEYTEHKISFHIFQTFPNPTHSATTIQYTLTESAHVVLKIYNVLGQEVKTLVNETQTQGPKTVLWDGRDNHSRVLGSGIYFCRLHAGDFEQSRKIIWVK